jgi:hypothetical protein
MASLPDPAVAALQPRTGLDALVRTLVDDGYRVVGPVVHDGVIEYAEIAGGDELPTGVRVEQAAGRWRLRHEGAQRFSWTPGADSWKKFVFPPRQEVLRIRRTDGSFAVSHPAAPARPLALIGARDCELKALGILDRVELDPANGVTGSSWWRSPVGCRRPRVGALRSAVAPGPTAVTTSS